MILPGSLRRSWVSLFMLALCACHSAPVAVPRPGAYPGYLASSESLGRPFVVQQGLRGRYGERDVSLDVVVQLAQGKLTLVGLTPFGSRAFVLEQTGTATRFEKFIDREIPFDPSYVLNDVHRVFFRGLVGPLPDGVHVGEDHGEKLMERWQAGVLVERRFERLDGQPKGAIVVRFRGAPAPVVAPEITLENRWFGYTLVISSPSQTWLESPTP
jgi:hypothetical protein